jgi:hypothetical protein
VLLFYILKFKFPLLFRKMTLNEDDEGYVLSVQRVVPSMNTLWNNLRKSGQIELEEEIYPNQTTTAVPDRTDISNSILESDDVAFEGGYDGEEEEGGIRHTSLSKGLYYDEKKENEEEESSIENNSSEVDTEKSIDWTKEFVDIMDRLEGVHEDEGFNPSPYSARENYEDYANLANLASNFLEVAKSYGKIIISEVALPVAEKTIKPCSDIGGAAGGEKYRVQNILFKVTLTLLFGMISYKISVCS